MNCHEPSGNARNRHRGLGLSLLHAARELRIIARPVATGTLLVRDAADPHRWVAVGSCC
jgi:hypothetical protein